MSDEVLRMPPKLSSDGPVRVQKMLDFLVADVTTCGVKSTITMSERQAWEVMVSIAVVLDLPIDPEMKKAFWEGAATEIGFVGSRATEVRR